LKIDLILVEYDSGRQHFRMANGPKRLIESGLEERLQGTGHTVRINRVVADTTNSNEIAVTFELHRGVARAVAKACAEWSFPIVVSGNCGSALGTTAGLRASGSAPAVCWLDAHADFNTPDTSESGFIDGMSLATLTGRAWRNLAASIPGFIPVPEWQVALVGARALDRLEAVALDESRIVRATLADADNAFRSMATESRRLYFHVDLDVLDPSVGRANMYSAPGGLTVDDVIRVMESARRRFDIAAAALTSYDPIADLDGRIARGAVDIAQALTQ
jgi:arginase